MRDKEKVIKAIVDELHRQSQHDRCNTPCLYGVYAPYRMVGIDGEVNIRMLAKAVLDSLATKGAKE